MGLGPWIVSSGRSRFIPLLCTLVITLVNQFQRWNGECLLGTVAELAVQLANLFSKLGYWTFYYEVWHDLLDR